MNSLVSVIISSYNSSPYIIETLESVTRQTWKEIELIISDDCSTDDTVDVCGKWIEKNSKRFIRTAFLKSDINTGVSANTNRGLFNSRGEWIKFLGADDTLKPLCLENNMNWVSSHPDARALFSRIEIYRDSFEPRNLMLTTPGIPYDPNGILAEDRTAESQYKMLLVSDRIHFTPSVFLHRQTLISLGGFDERFRLLEDYPLWLNLTRNGYKLYFMEDVTVNYRRHAKAINNTGKKYIVNPNYFLSEGFRKIYTYPFLPADLRMQARYKWFVSQLFRFSWFNSDKKFNKILNSILSDWINPFRYFIWLKKHFNRDLKYNEFYS